MAPARRDCKRQAFTLVEVMVAMTVLVLVFASTVSALTVAFRVVEDSRMDTLASQILQSEMENIRLKNWSEMEALPASDTFTVDSMLADASFHRFTCQRTVTNLGSNLKQVVLTASWTGTDGVPRTRRYLTYIGEGGLNDYFYNHP